MKAVVCRDFGESKLEDVPRADPASNEVLISVDVVQLSITECLQYRGVDISNLEAVRERLKGGGARLFGHEFSGRVIERGDDVTEFETGDRVFAPGKVACGDCLYCTNNQPHFCENKEHLGKDRPGAVAEYIALPESTLCGLPDDVTDAEGAALQPLVSAFASTYSADLESGETVAIIGTGVMGYQCGQLALETGAKDVYAIDIVPEKLELAEEKGMVPVNSTEVDSVKRIRNRTNGVGVDVVFEAVGGEQDHGTEGDDPLAMAFDMVRYDGRVVQTGYISGEISLAPGVIRSKCVDWINPKRGVFPLTVAEDAGSYVAELVSSGRVSIAEYITTQVDGLDSFEEAVEMTLNKDEYGALGPSQIVVNP